MAEVTAHALPIETLLLTVFQSITEVFLLCLAGYILASTGVTDKATQRKLNVINVSLFTPALLFSKVAFSLTPAKLKEMWIIPLGFVLITSVSAAVAYVLSKVFRLKKSQTAFAMCAAMFQNSNSLPIALVQSLVVVVPGLKWGKDDSKDQMLGRALTYMVLYSTLGMILRWSWGVKLLSSADDSQPAEQPSEHAELSPILEAAENGTANGGGVHEEPEMLSTPLIHEHDRDPFSDAAGRHIGSTPFRHRTMSPSPGRVTSPSPSLPLDQTSTSANLLHSTVHAPRRAASLPRRGSFNGFRRRRSLSRTDSGREFWGLPEQPRSRHLVDVAEDSSESEGEDDEEWGGRNSLRRRISPSRSGWALALQKTKHKLKSAWATFNSFMTVPTWAALLSIFIALIPPLQAKLNAAVPFVHAVKSAGQCSIPVTLVVLGAFFYTPPPAITLPVDEEEEKGIKGFIKAQVRKWKESAEQNAKTRAMYPGEDRTVFVAVISRMVVCPLIFLPFIALIARYDLFPAAADPVFILCAVLLVSSPPALTLAQITQAASGDAFERLISKTISWSYAVLTPPLTLIYVVVGLLFANL